MVPPQTLSLILVISLLLLSGHAIAQYSPKERDALYALRDVFNHHLLNQNWTGAHCHHNNTRWYGILCLNGRVTAIWLQGMGLTGEVNFHALAKFPELTYLSFKDNSISGELMDFSANQKLKHIDLSGNMFHGPISGSLVGLDFLVSLKLQNNYLTGQIPEFSQLMLREFDVSYNNLSGRIPTTGNLQILDFSSYYGNPELCGAPSPIACKNSSENESSTVRKKDKDNSFIGVPLIAVFVVLGVIVLALVVLLSVLYYKKSKKFKEMKGKVEIKKNNGKNIFGEERSAVAREGRGRLTFIDDDEGGFELVDLFKAPAQGLGKGNFGNCYMAMLDNGEAFVVKRLRDLRPLTSEEFREQMRVMADLKHPNLLPLLAYYYSEAEKLLVYKFVENGNLFNRIHGARERNRIPFRWKSRLSIAQDVARAVECLHRNTDSQNTIPHGNLRSSNVLLDVHNVALVSDYGLASLIAHPIATQRMVSYKSPEYQHRKKITKKSDVWSYGCLLLELLTGRISALSAPQGNNGVDLCTWVHRAVREEWTGEIFDSEITVQRNAYEGMLTLLQLALRCCEKSPEKRPEMEEVLRKVNDIKFSNAEDDDDFSRSLTEDSISSYASG